MKEMYSYQIIGWLQLFKCTAKINLFSLSAKKYLLISYILFDNNKENTVIPPIIRKQKKKCPFEKSI